MKDNQRTWTVVAKTHGLTIHSRIRGMAEVTKLIRLYSQIGYSWRVMA